MFDERHAYAAQFRELGARFTALAAAADPLAEYETLTTAGELTISSCRAGYLALPGLRALAEWAETPTPDGVPGKCVRVHCPANLFLDVCGLNRIPVYNQGGEIAVTGDHAGGLIPEALGHSPALRGPRQGEPPAKQHEIGLRHKAFVCRLLADEIERTDPRDARDRWMYEQRMAGRVWSWIWKNVPGWCPNGEQITTVEGVRRAVERYRLKCNLPAIPKGKAGRRKNIN